MLTSAIFVTACEEVSEFNPFDKAKEETEASAPQTSSETTIIERDVEAPEVFQKTETGLWDGRPSLGGVWVAHPDVVDPERVIIRNQTNGKFVIGALFRRERENPGPRFQISSDAAAALGMLAGAPAELNVTALRREEIPVAPEVSEPALDAPEVIEQTTLDPVAAAAAAAIAAAEAKEMGTEPPVIIPADTQTASAAPAPVVTSQPLTAQKSSLDKPYVQIGIFSVQTNATGTADMLRSKGIIPTIKKGSSSGKEFWRVIVGPAMTKSERSSLIKKVQGLGFADAYAVSN